MKNNTLEVPTALQGRSTQFPLVVGKCVSAALVLSLLTHRRASPLITWADLRSWGSAPRASAGRKEGRSSGWHLQHVSHRPPVWTPCPVHPLAAHRQHGLRKTFQDSCVKEKTVPPRLGSDRVTSTRSPWSSHHVWWEPHLPLRMLGLFTRVVLWATVICPQETEILVDQSVKPVDICPLGRS